MNLHTPCVLNIAGKSSNDIYQVNVPSNLLGFCKFDFTHFAEDCNQLCRDCMKTGEYPVDEVNVIRNSISGCHRYYENNMRGIFDKIVVDCWIDYICRQGEMSVSTLWNSFIECKTPFEKVVFQRLSEYRAHRAINRWTNLLKVQEYAQKKLDYVFSCKLNKLEEAVGRLNVFDLMFSVAANEQGYSLDTVSSVKVYRPGRLSSSPFVFSGAAKEIMRNLFKNVHFAESQPYISKEEGAIADWESMDAFGAIKSYLPDHSDNVVNTIIKSMVKVPEKVYVPSGFKAIIDLEIDSLISSGAFLQRCRRCNEFYIRDDYYTSEYCDAVHRDGSTCREIMEQPKFDPPTPEELDMLKEKSDSLYKDISERVGKNISQRDFTEWLGYFNVIKTKVFNGEARPSDFDDFVSYTNQFSFPPPVEREESAEPQEQEIEETSPDGKKIKPYQFTRIDRKELEQSGALKPIERGEESPIPDVEKKAPVAPPPPVVAKIIRGADPSVYREMPARPISTGETNAVKKDVYLGEDFSLGGSAESTGENTGAAIRSIAENAAEDNRRKTEKPISGIGEETHFLPDLDQFEDFSEPDDEPELPKSKAPKVKLPVPAMSVGEKIPTDSDGFKDLFAESEKRNAKESVLSPSDTLSAEKVNEPKLNYAQNNPSSDDEKIDESVTSISSEKKPDPKNSAYSRYSANSAYGGTRLNFSLNDSDKPSETAQEEIIRSRPEEMEGKNNKHARENSEAKEKNAETNRAAKVVNAYKTVNDMPVSQSAPHKKESGGNANGISDEFARILDSIERNDGFEEENLPLDPDGVPLSHKTKHVMDAIMKNTGVSPSLIYGRRQAAEKNVVLDDSFGEKKSSRY